MGKTDPHQDDHGPAGAEHEAADARQTQLPFSEPVTPPTMTSEHSAEPVQSATSDVSPATDTEAMEQVTDEMLDAGTAASLAVLDVPQTDTSLPVPESLGQRLRATREARGLRIEDAAQQMKLPLGTVQALEADRYERIGEGIYLRSYLCKYLRLLDLPQVLAERVLTQHAEPPPLITSGTISRPRYLFERYSSSALYLVLTAVIIVPAVWLAMRAGFETGVAQITPLDGPQAASAAVASSVPAQSATGGNAGAEHEDEAPLVASLAPFPPIKHESAEPAAEKTVAAAANPKPLAAGEHAVRLTLAEPSWVEIVAADGEKLEYGLLPAGTVRSYHSSKAIDVRLGNSVGASVEIDGKSTDLTPFRRSNVAHFRLSGGEATPSHSGG